MAAREHWGPLKTSPAAYVVSGGVGASGEQLVRTALAQFDDVDVPVVVVPRVRSIEQLEGAVNQAAARGGMIVHTLVDLEMRQPIDETLQCLLRRHSSASNIAQQATRFVVRPIVDSAAREACALASGQLPQRLEAMETAGRRVTRKLH